MHICILEILKLELHIYQQYPVGLYLQFVLGQSENQFNILFVSIKIQDCPDLVSSFRQTPQAATQCLCVLGDIDQWQFIQKIYG